jgi:hypothetical protein
VRAGRVCQRRATGVLWGTSFYLLWANHRQGRAYYVENADALKLVAIDRGVGCMLPDSETVRANTYRPLTQ